jgi:hypothetical protein
MSDIGNKNVLVTTAVTVGIGVGATLYWFFGGMNSSKKGSRKGSRKSVSDPFNYQHEENKEHNDQENSDDETESINNTNTIGEESVQTQLENLQEKYAKQASLLVSCTASLKNLLRDTQILEQKVAQNTNNVNSNNIRLQTLEMKNPECSFFENHSSLETTPRLSDADNASSLQTVGEQEDINQTPTKNVMEYREQVVSSTVNNSEKN